MIAVVQLIKATWYRHAKEAFYLAATTFWGYMTIAFYIPILLQVR